MKLKKAWLITLDDGYEYIVFGRFTTDALNWAKKRNYKITRIKLLLPN